MTRLPFLRPLLLFLALLALVALACDSGGEEPAATTAPAATATTAPAVTDTTAPPAPTPVSTGAGQSDNGNGGQTTSADGLEDAFERATTMMAQNAKPTPPPPGGTNGKDDENGTTAPTQVPPTPAPQVDSPSLRLQNSASVPACFVYISLPTEDTWGPDQLGESEIIEVGASRDFELAADTYDVRIDDCNGKVMHFEFGLEVSGPTSIALKDQPTPTAGDAPLTVINDLESNACYLYISPTTDDSWGDDWLGTGYVLAAGDTTVINVPAGDYDLNALDCAYETLREEYGITVGSSGQVFALSGASSGQAALEMINEGSTTICYVQISLSTETEWGPDWLGETETIGGGSSRTFELLPNTYDIRALDCDQETLKEEYGVNITGNTAWTVP
jgi:hypothetical protein